MSEVNRVVSLAHVQYMEMQYVNQYGQSATKKPSFPTVRLERADNTVAAYHSDYPNETLLERARRLNLLDDWRLQVRVIFTANKSLVFFGKRARSLWSAWKEKQYGQ